MEKYITNGPFGHQPVYVLKNLNDFKEYEEYLGEEAIKCFNPNFYSIKKDFKEYLGTIRKQASYDENDKEIITEYLVIGIEDNYAYGDWYWILQEINNPKIITYVNINDQGFYDK